MFFGFLLGVIYKWRGTLGCVWWLAGSGLDQTCPSLEKSPASESHTFNNNQLSHSGIFQSEWQGCQWPCLSVLVWCFKEAPLSLIRLGCSDDSVFSSCLSMKVIIYLCLCEWPWQNLVRLICFLVTSWGTCQKVVGKQIQLGGLSRSPSTRGTRTGATPAPLLSPWSPLSPVSPIHHPHH